MSKELKILYKKDQYHTGRWEKYYTKRQYLQFNKNLVKRLEDLFKKNKINSGKDYFIATIILHHSFNIANSKKALNYSKLAVEKGYKKGKWFIASATDRLLQLQRKPQKFGTQVEDMNAKKLKIYKLNSKTTDKERKEFGLPTLNQIKKGYGIK